MRTRSPALRTLPSSTAPTPSARPISRTSAARPLNWNDEVREAMRRSRMQHSELMISSAMPSQKYSWSRPGLMSTNGRMATESGASAAAVGGSTAGSTFGSSRCRHGGIGRGQVGRPLDALRRHVERPGERAGERESEGGERDHQLECPRRQAHGLERRARDLHQQPRADEIDGRDAKHLATLQFREPPSCLGIVVRHPDLPPAPIIGAVEPPTLGIVTCGRGMPLSPARVPQGARGAPCGSRRRSRRARAGARCRAMFSGNPSSPRRGRNSDWPAITYSTGATISLQHASASSRR